MATSAQDFLQPALLDRLTDDDPGHRTEARARLNFRLGKLYFLDRTAPREIEVETGAAVLRLWLVHGNLRGGSMCLRS